MIDNDMDKYLAGDEMHDIPEVRKTFFETVPFTIITSICALLAIISCALLPFMALLYLGSKTYKLWF